MPNQGNDNQVRKPAPQVKAATNAKEGKPEASRSNDIIQNIIAQIEATNSILVALSKNPSVDEMTAAIALTMMLDRGGKHATAIYSGKTPNALEFLEPEKTFESNTNSLQDFIIALNKDKADHLRYKLEGDYVKVYITPYRTVLGEEDLEFSHGDYNVDLVIALDVPTAEDLDAALAEYGRIMHDATAINITTGVPGKFAEMEWSSPAESSVSEMVADLLFLMKEQLGEVDKEIATTLLTGIVAATDRFSNEKTTPKTMALASKLMSLGADQQLVSKNILKVDEPEVEEAAAPAGDGSLTIDHAEEQQPVLEEVVTPAEQVLGPVITPSQETVAEAVPEPDLTPEQQLEQIVQPKPLEELPMMKELQDVAKEIAADAAAPYGKDVVVPIENTEKREVVALEEPSEPLTPVTLEDSEEQDSGVDLAVGMPGSGGTTVIEPLSGAKTEAEIEGLSGEPNKDYAKMMEEALAEPIPGQQQAPLINQPQVEEQPQVVPESVPQSSATVQQNPATLNAPAAPAAPELNHIPTIDYTQPNPAVAEQPPQSPLPMPNPELMPPPPAPKVDFATPLPPEKSTQVEQPGQVVQQVEPAMSGSVEPAMPAPVEPVMPAPTATPDPSATAVATPTVVPVTNQAEVPTQPVDPGAFQIPGMPH